MKQVTAHTAACSGSTLSMTGASLQQKHLSMSKVAEMRVIPDARHDVIWDHPGASFNVTRLFLSTGKQK